MSPYTPYYPIQVAKNLRFVNTNGDLVSQLYPVAFTQVDNSPATGYISLIGAKLSEQIDLYTQVIDVLSAYNTRIVNLENTVADILSSGATVIPYVSGGCLNGSIAAPVQDIVDLLVDNSCDYNTALGSTTALNTSTLILGPDINTLPAYSQNSTMSGLAGWRTSPATTADIINNIGLAYLDARAGVSQALSQSNITCADVILNYQGVYSILNQSVTFYFYGSSIPANFSGSPANSGNFTITDVDGNIFTQDFNLYTIVSTNGFVTYDLSESALVQNSSYNVVLGYNLTSTTPSLTCQGGKPGTVINNTQVCPNLAVTGVTGSTIQFSFTPTVVQNAVYTVSLLDASGTTVLATKVYNAPSSLTTDTFTGLTASTDYTLRVQVTVNDTITTCPLVTTKTDI